MPAPHQDTLKEAADARPTRPDLLVFSDLDGTLLDHHTYEWDAAKPGLDRLRALGAGLVLSSSKTAAEIVPLQQEMGCETWPAIVENGAGVLWPGHEEDARSDDYSAIRETLTRIGAPFLGFGDMSAQEIAERTGLPLERAHLAKQRRYSEPGLWQGPPRDLEAFLERLAEHGFIARQGGRFLTISAGRTKADAMKAVVAQLKPVHTIALGDAPNDVEMLTLADHGVVIANSAGPTVPTLPAEADGRITRTQQEGPAGWSDSILALTSTLFPTPLSAAET